MGGSQRWGGLGKWGFSEAAVGPRPGALKLRGGLPPYPAPRFWPAIDDGLRRAAYERGIKVRLLISCWGHSDPSMRAFLLSLAALRDNHTHSDIQVVSTCPDPPLNPCAGQCGDTAPVALTWHLTEMTQSGLCPDWGGGGLTTSQGWNQGRGQRSHGQEGGAPRKLLLQP